MAPERNQGEIGSLWAGGTLRERFSRLMRRIHQARAAVMERMPLRLRAPRGLYWRAILIILMSIVVMQAVVTYAFFDGHWDEANRKLSEGVAGNIAFLVELYEQAPDRFERYVETLHDTAGLSATIRLNAELPEQTPPTILLRPVDRTLAQKLSEALDTRFWFDTVSHPELVDIRAELPEGRGILRALVLRDRVHVTGGHLFIWWMCGVTLVLSLVAMVFIRNQIRPIEDLAYAADGFGRGVDLPDFKPRGAWEVRIAAQSVLRMRDRIRRFAEQRTSMLASVSHDLRTPLTRLRLELAMLENVDMAAADADITQMERMLDGYLAFARGHSEEDAKLIDLKPMLEEIGAAAPDGAVLEVAVPVSVKMRLRPTTLHRAVANLVNNAVAHAKRVRISLEVTEVDVKIMIDDDGPGIPRDRRAEAFRPFARLDPARNQNVGGVGLGLAASRDAARVHGGDVLLSDSPFGGLRAIMRLPRRSDTGRGRRDVASAP